MSDKESSSSDMECDDVTEGATVRVVQSSMHASIKQNSLFRVTESKKESEKDSDEELPPKPEEKKENPPEEEKKEEKIEEAKEEVKEVVPEKPSEEETKVVPEVLVQPEPVPEVKPVEKKPKVYSKAVMKILADDPPKPQPEALDIQKRFYDYQSKINKKVQELQEEKDKQQLELCTFTPKIKKSEKRKFEQFLNHVTKFENNKKDRIEKAKKEKESEMPKKSSFKPTLSEKTIQLTKDLKPELEIHQRLYKESEVLKSKQEQLAKEILDSHCSFKPKIESDLKREGDTRLRLFELSKAKPVVPEAQTNVKLVDIESENIVRTKFVKKIDELLPLSLNKPSKSPDGVEKIEEEGKGEPILLSFSEFLNLLVKLGFLHEKSEKNAFAAEYELAGKAWATFGVDQSATIPASKIKDFALEVLNLTEGGSGNTHLNFIQFYINSQSHPAAAHVDSSPFSFKPSIIAKSQKLATIVNETRASNLGNKKIDNILYTLHQKKLKKLHDRKALLDEYLSPECTFQPQTTRGPRFEEEDFKDSMSLSSDYLRLLSEKKLPRNEALYSFSKMELERKEKASRTVEEWEYEKNMGECSFVPDLDKPKIDLKAGNDAKGVEQVVERMKKAREDRKSELFLPGMKFGLEKQK